MSEASTNKLPRLKISLAVPKSVRLDILEASTALKGKSCQLLVGILIAVSINRSSTIVLSRRIMKRVSISRFGTTDALRRLEEAGMLRAHRQKGRSTTVTVLDPVTGQPLILSAEAAPRSTLADGRPAA